MSPYEARERENFNQVSKIMSSQSSHYIRNIDKPRKIEIGDRVRILLNKIPHRRNIFSKGYIPKWSERVYKIADTRYDGV